jgi:hypothetical protein
MSYKSFTCIVSVQILPSANIKRSTKQIKEFLEENLSDEQLSCNKCNLKGKVKISIAQLASALRAYCRLGSSSVSSPAL